MANLSPPVAEQHTSSKGISQRLAVPALALLAVFVVASLVGPIRSAKGEDNLYVHQAAAFLKGRLDIPRHYHDAAVFEGRYYVPFPPAPAVLMLPLVAVLGVHRTNPVLVGLAATALSVWLLWRILRRLGVEKAAIPWLLTGYFFGTVYWSCIKMGAGVWFTAHLVSTAALFGAIDEALGRKRGALVGLYLGISFLSRQLTALLAPFFLALLLTGGETSTKARLRRLVGFGASCALLGGAYLAFNWARFGDPFDSGYRYLLLGGHLLERFVQFGLFHPRYVLFNAFYLFIQGFHIVFTGSRFLTIAGMDPWGTSLIAASPFLLAAVAARWERPLLWAAWGSVILCIVPQLFYYNNGWWQINGQRFAMDFLPVLIVLTALGVRRVQGAVWKGAIVYAVALNALALVIIPWLAVG